jgi:hypothetical protein
MPTGKPLPFAVHSIPAVVGVSKCLLAHMVPIVGGAVRTAVNNNHPAKCSFCDISYDEKLDALDKWWDRYDTQESVRLQVETFESLPEEDQRRAVIKAMGWTEMPKPDFDTSVRPKRKRGF